MSNTKDIMSVYRQEDEKNIDLTQKYFSISPPFMGDGATQSSINITNQDIDQFRKDPYFRTISTYYGTDDNNLTSKRRIALYREILKYPEVDNVVNQIVADAIVFDEKKRFVHIDLDETDFSDSIKKRIQEEFEEVLKLYKTKQNAMRHFKKYYVDSKIFFHKVIDPKKPHEGIKELRELDPRLINLYRRNLYETDEFGKNIWVGYEDFFIYESPVVDNKYGYDFTYSSIGTGNRIEIPRSAITYAHSGLTDCQGQIVGHLHQAIKPAHTLKMLEDALVIYRVTRAPDRKVFYIDTGNLTDNQAREVMENLKRSHSSKVVYDTETGKFDNYKNQMLVTDDYWLQRQNGHANAEIDTLPGASGMNEIEDIKWHNRKLYEALKVPLSRMPNENAFVVMGDDGGTSRDERNFQKFIDQTRGYYSEVFLDPLMTNLILKGIISTEEWEDNVDNIIVKYNRDQYYTEIAELEILERRVDLLAKFEQYRNKYVSGKYIMKEILRYTDEDIEQMQQEILDERYDEVLNPPIKVDQYGKTVNDAELGTASTDVEQVIPQEFMPQGYGGPTGSPKKEDDESVNESIEFKLYQ